MSLPGRKFDLGHLAVGSWHQTDSKKQRRNAEMPGAGPSTFSIPVRCPSSFWDEWFKQPTARVTQRHQSANGAAARQRAMMVRCLTSQIFRSALLWFWLRGAVLAWQVALSRLVLVHFFPSPFVRRRSEGRWMLPLCAPDLDKLHVTPTPSSSLGRR